AQLGIGSDNGAPTDAEVSSGRCEDGGTDHVDGVGHSFERARVGWRRRDRLDEDPRQCVATEKDFALVLEVPEEGAFGQPGPRCDFDDARVVVPSLLEQFDGGADESLGRIWLPASHGGHLSDGTWSHRCYSDGTKSHRICGEASNEPFCR